MHRAVSSLAQQGLSWIFSCPAPQSSRQKSRGSGCRHSRDPAASGTSTTWTGCRKYGQREAHLGENKPGRNTEWEKLEADNCRWGSDAEARTWEHYLRRTPAWHFWEAVAGRATVMWWGPWRWLRTGTEAASTGLGTEVKSTGESMGWDCQREELEETLEEDSMLEETGSAMRPLYCRDRNGTRGSSINKTYCIPRRFQSS